MGSGDPKETFAEVATREAARLQAAGLEAEDARRDVAVLARWLLDWDSAAWLARQRESAPADFAARLLALVERRIRREPIAYITGAREFFGRVFHVTRDVLIPRPETELVVEETLAALSTLRPEAQGLRPLMVDVGTGSGCLAITLALECRSCRMVATDISAEALAVARENARRLGAHSIEFRSGSLLADVSPPIDLVVSNPPYVPLGASLPPEVADFEPRTALFAGADGLETIRALVSAAAHVLRPGGWLIIEIGAGQAAEVRAIVEREGLQLIKIRADLQQIPRVAVIMRHV